MHRYGGQVQMLWSGMFDDGDMQLWFNRGDRNCGVIWSGWNVPGISNGWPAYNKFIVFHTVYFYIILKSVCGNING